MRASIIAILFLICSPINAVELDINAEKRQGDLAFDRKDFQKAIKIYENVLAIVNKKKDEHYAPGVRHQLGFSYLAVGDKKKALAQFLKNIDYHNKYNNLHYAAPNYHYAGDILIDLSNYQEAIDLLSEYPINIDKDQARKTHIFVLLVMANERLGDNRAAIRTLEKAKRIVTEEAWLTYFSDDYKRIKLKSSDWYNNSLYLWYLVYVGVVVSIIIVLLVLPIKRGKAESVLVVASFAIALILVEIYLEYAQPGSDEVLHFVNSPNTLMRFKPAPNIMPGIEYEQSAFSVNNIGLRGDDYDQNAENYIVVIGGSSVEALYVDDSDAWPHVLQQELNQIVNKKMYGVGNAGRSGLNSVGNYVQLLYIIPEIRPDVVIVQMGINDLNSCISGNQQTLKYAHENLNWPDFIDEYKVKVFNKINATSQPVQPKIITLVQSMITEQEPPVEPNKHHEFYVVQDTSGEFYDIQRKRRQEASILDIKPNISDCLVYYKKNVERMISFASKNETEIIFLTQGSLYRSDLNQSESDLLWFGSVNKGFFDKQAPKEYYSVNVMRQLLDEYNHTLLQLCRRYSLRCLNTDYVLSKTIDHYYDDVHLNTLGSRKLGKLLSDYLRHGSKKLLFPRTVDAR